MTRFIGSDLATKRVRGAAQLSNVGVDPVESLPHVWLVDGKVHQHQRHQVPEGVAAFVLPP